MPPQPSIGKWEIILNTEGCPLNTQQEAIHSCIIYNEQTGKWKVLFYTAFYEEGNDPYYITTRVLDLESTGIVPPISTQVIPNWPPPLYDDLPKLFCCGHAFDSNGKLLTAGGHRRLASNTEHHWALGLPYTYWFNPVTEQWEVATKQFTGQPILMSDGRWYPTVTKLGWGGSGSRDRFVVVAGYKYDEDPITGSPVYNDWVEIYDPANGWELLPPQANMPTEFAEKNANYPGAHLIPFNNQYHGNIKAGEVFYPMPLKNSWRFNPDGQGSPNPYWNHTATSRHVRVSGASVMLPIKPNSSSMRYVLFGGAEDEHKMPTKQVEMIDLSEQPAGDYFTWHLLTDLIIPRKNINCVLLPDGKIMIVGGNQLHLRETGVTVCEMYDPEFNNYQGKTEILPALTYPKSYHSTAILLPDARVLASGGEFLCTGIGNNNNNLNNTFEIYTPGYLEEGPRPNIITTFPYNVTYGQNINFETDVEIAEAILIRPGAPTHGFDMEQRAIYLNLTAGPINGNYPYTITMPANGYIAPPGIYMLFVLRPKSASSSTQHKIPSVAKFVKLG